MKNATSPTILIIMGVSGTGKSTIGKSLSQKLNWPYFEGDDYHPAENVEKMRKGHALNDADRAPWLGILRDLIEQQFSKNESAIFASSALKNQYRDILAKQDPRVRFVFLEGSFDLILNRLKQRSHEYMPPTLLQSQFDTLEEPKEAIRVSIDQPIEDIVKFVLGELQKA